MPGTPEVDVAIIGAGIVGSATAAWLTRTGKRVALVDRLPPGEACSHGNAGMMSPGAVVPYAAPGTLRQIPKWLLDPLGPLAIRWAYLPRALPWLMRWVRSSTPERATAVSRGLVALHSS